MTVRALTRTLRTMIPVWSRGKTVVRVYDPATGVLADVRRVVGGDGSVILELKR
jgi:hypothetical protein